MYQQDIESVIAKLQTKRSGLTSIEASKRLLQYGKNIIKHRKKTHFALVFLKQFTDLLVIILIISALISFVINDVDSAIVILTVIVLNAFLGTIEFYKANKFAEGLKTLDKKQSLVMRDGKKIVIPTEEIVPGDLLVINSGDVIAADGRLIEVNNLMVHESSLTGESDLVIKHIEKINEVKGIADQGNMVFSGSNVSSGSGLVVVTKTGMQTEIGRIALLIEQAKNKKTPLQMKLDRFSQGLAFVILLICIAVFLLNLSRGDNAFDAMMFAVALAVAAIPEALGSIVTITLAIATEKMARRNTIVKDLKALEGLGTASVICTDKTGTITQNVMRVCEVFSQDHVYSAQMANDERIFQAAYYCHNAYRINGDLMGDPTDVAIAMMGEKAYNGNRKFRRIKEIPFDSTRKMMSVVVEDTTKILFSKGAVESILEKSKYYQNAGCLLTRNDFYRINKVNRDFACKGLRAIAFAYKTINDLEDELIFLGIFGIIDPPKENIEQGIALANKAHVEVVMITGDHPETAQAISKAIGMKKKKILTGNQLKLLSDDELRLTCNEYNIYARTTPEDKLRIVKAWQENNEVVIMVGDGVNDAPALKNADIGIAMGHGGSNVSQEASSIILADDKFNTIVSSIITGRSIFQNITNAIAFLISGNIAGILVVLYASILHLPKPFSPEHLLFINLLTDSIPAIAIGMTKENNELLNRYPRKRNESIINTSLWRRVILEGMLMAIATILAFYFGLKTSIFCGMTLAFSTLCLARLYHSFNSTTKGSIIRFGIENNYTIWAFLLGLVVLNFVLFFTPLMSLFDVAILSISEIIALNLLAIMPTLVIQTYKFIKEMRHTNG